MNFTHSDEAYEGQDFYCDVAIPGVSELRVEHDDEWVLAYHHTRPFWNHHIVAVPKKHISSLTTVTAQDEEWIRRLFQVVQRLAGNLERQEGAASVVTNLGRYQDSKHLHVHIHSGGPRASEATDSPA